jgi:hypothetical protein
MSYLTLYLTCVSLSFRPVQAQSTNKQDRHRALSRTAACIGFCIGTSRSTIPSSNRLSCPPISIPITTLVIYPVVALRIRASAILSHTCSWCIDAALDRIARRGEALPVAAIILVVPVVSVPISVSVLVRLANNQSGLTSLIGLTTKSQSGQSQARAFILSVRSD